MATRENFEDFEIEFEDELDEDFDYSDDESYSTMDLMEDVENKLEDLIEEKIEIIANVLKLRLFNSGEIDEASFIHICSFMTEIFDEVTNEQIVLNKLYDYLTSKVDELTPTEFEYGNTYTEYLNLLNYFEEVEDTRLGEYIAYVDKIGHLVRTNSVSPSYLEPHRQFTQLDEEKTNDIKKKVPSIKK